MKSAIIGLSLAFAFGGLVEAATLTAPMRLATPDGPGAGVGLVVISDGPGGAVFAVDLAGLPPGAHGFHVHAGGSCATGPDKAGKLVAAGAAAGHMDPASTGRHAGPDGMGHLGDLPALTVGLDGVAKASLTAPHIVSVQSLAGHTLMIHAGGDTYSDTPAPLGGGGARIACGVIG